MLLGNAEPVDLVMHQNGPTAVLEAPQAAQPRTTFVWGGYAFPAAAVLTSAAIVGSALLGAILAHGAANGSD